MVNYQALVDLFRQSFSPIAQLGANRLALEQAAVERNFAARQMEARRQAALQDHLAGIRLQHELAGERERESAREAYSRALALEELRGENATLSAAASTGAAMAANRKSAEEARIARDLETARKLAADMGIADVDPDDPDYVNKVTKAAASATAKHRKSATEIARELTGLSTQIDKLSNAVDLSEAEQVKLARPLLLANVDPEKASAFRKLGTLDEIMEAAAEVGAADKIIKAIQTAQDQRNKSFERKVRPLVGRQQQLQRTMSVLEARGISPDYDALRVNVEPPADAAAAEPVAGELTDEDIGALFPSSKAAAAPATSRTLETSAAATAAGLGMTKAGRGSTRALTTAARGAGSLARPVLGTVARGVAGPVGAASLINDIPTFFGGEPMSASLAGLALQAANADYDSEVGRQKGTLAMIDALIPRSTPDQSRQLRALRYAPTLDEDAIANVMGLPSGGGIYSLGPGVSPLRRLITAQPAMAGQ